MSEFKERIAKVLALLSAYNDTTNIEAASVIKDQQARIEELEKTGSTAKQRTFYVSFSATNKFGEQKFRFQVMCIGFKSMNEVTLLTLQETLKTMYNAESVTILFYKELEE